MPFINISVAGPELSDAQKQRLFDETTRLMKDVMNKNSELTSVRIDQFPGGNWAVGGTPTHVRGEVGAHMDIKVTAGTNTEDEKADMIRHGMTMLKDVVGSVPEASYIVIHELDARDWGYDGRTQQARAQQRDAA